MIVKFDGKNYHELFKKYKKFILHVFLEEQKIQKESNFLTISPSDSNIYETANGHLQVVDVFPDIIYVETFHSQSYDLVNNFGIDYDNEVWDDSNGHYKPIIIGVKNGRMVSNSLGRCYCLETYMDIIYSIHPELFEPPSVSES